MEAKASKPSTNSERIRSTRQGSVSTKAGSLRWRRNASSVVPEASVVVILPRRIRFLLVTSVSLQGVPGQHPSFVSQAGIDKPAQPPASVPAVQGGSNERGGCRGQQPREPSERIRLLHSPADEDDPNDRAHREEEKRSGAAEPSVGSRLARGARTLADRSQRRPSQSRIVRSRAIPRARRARPLADPHGFQSNRLLLARLAGR